MQLPTDMTKDLAEMQGPLFAERSIMRTIENSEQQKCTYTILRKSKKILLFKIIYYFREKQPESLWFFFIFLVRLYKKLFYFCATIEMLGAFRILTNKENRRLICRRI